MRRIFTLGLCLILTGGVAMANEVAVDTQQKRTESLRRTELAFAASVRDRDQAAFADFIADDAVFVGSSILRGKAAVVEAWRVFFAPDGPVLDWWPEVVELAEDGHLGLTRGPYELTVESAQQPEVSRGLFNSVWRLEEDGAWRIVFDAGCSQ